MYLPYIAQSVIEKMVKNSYEVRTQEISTFQDGARETEFEVPVASFVYSYAPPLESDEGKKIRLNVEKLWIHRMKTNRPPGLNILG